jgi:hypothetical protein
LLVVFLAYGLARRTTGALEDDNNNAGAGAGAADDDENGWTVEGRADVDKSSLMPRC